MKKAVLVFLAFSLFAFASCQQKNDIEKERIAKAELYVNAWNTGDLSLFDEVLSPECVRHHVDMDMDFKGAEAIKQYAASVRVSFPDFKVSLDELIIAENHSIGRWTVTGTNTGPIGDSPPTGQKVKYSGIEVSRIVDEKVVESWIYFNQAAQLIQLGYTITPPK